MALEIITTRGTTKVICGAKNARGGVCQNSPVSGATRCKFHGGNNPKGVAHPNFVDGKYSKYLPHRLLDKYHEALLDEDPYSLRQEVALLDARLMLLASQLKVGDSADLIRNLVGVRETLEKLSSLGEDVDPASLEELSAQVLKLVEEATNERRHWYEIYDVVESRRRLVESERKREEAAQHQITEGQGLVLIAALVDIVRKYVDDRNTLNLIASDIAALATRQTGRQSEG